MQILLYAQYTTQLLGPVLTEKKLPVCCSANGITEFFYICESLQGIKQ
jgi:hypothetical protein